MTNTGYPDCAPQFPNLSWVDGTRFNADEVSLQLSDNAGEPKGEKETTCTTSPSTLPTQQSMPPPDKELVGFPVRAPSTMSALVLSIYDGQDSGQQQQHHHHRHQQRTSSQLQNGGAAQGEAVDKKQAGECVELAMRFRESLAQNLNAAGQTPFLWDFAGVGKWPRELFRLDCRRGAPYHITPALRRVSSGTQDSIPSSRKPDWNRP
ncbi:hypothetical protein F4821DRAFT_263696 [Hypoxylon rubiginosum]|uniref:Uncharacterized protein n=1 Tax=Hypoxylon rubiginosum TaxID=110542 RepID=A0ACC0CQE6_9PEZI|nr:hypothetical protein F4821DRAFT_263696 [Hypoxylon rubiginosum]